MPASLLANHVNLPHGLMDLAEACPAGGEVSQRVWPDLDHFVAVMSVRRRTLQKMAILVLLDLAAPEAGSAGPDAALSAIVASKA